MSLKTSLILVLTVLSGVSLAAQASTGVSCLIHGKLIEKMTVTGESKHQYTVVIKQSANDSASRNDFKDCRTRFKRGQKLVFSSVENIDLKQTPRVWLQYNYGDDRGGARWEGYQLINRNIYKERQNGLLR
jgi:hypothetical protein